MNLPLTSLSGFHRLLFLCENGSEAYLNVLDLSQCWRWAFLIMFHHFHLLLDAIVGMAVWMSNDGDWILLSSES